MNQLPIKKRVQIITALIEGNSMRSTSRMSGCSINTVTKLLIDVGKYCLKYHDEHVREIHCRRAECDELWAYIGMKERQVPEEQKGTHGIGDAWTWVGMDAETKLVISFYVGKREPVDAYNFMHDLAERTVGRLQLTTDGLRAYINAVDEAFGGRVDYAQLVKIYGGAEGANMTERKYSPLECTGAKKVVISGNPNEEFISTSYVERQNLTIRMGMRRFTRLTNGYSKKLAHLIYALGLFYVYYNFCRVHHTLRVTPAMEAGLTHDFLTIEQIVIGAEELKRKEKEE